MTFKEYLMTRRITDTPNGDFVGDAKRDRQFPDARSWDQVESYLVNRGAPYAAIEAGKSVWKAYLRNRSAET